MRFRIPIFSVLVAAFAAAGASCSSPMTDAGGSHPARTPMAATIPQSTQSAAKKNPVDRFESSIKAFEAADALKMPAPGGTVFVGSSTFEKWKSLETDFKEFHAINRGFGGSTIPEVLHYTDRVVIKYKPSTIVFFCGTNDMADGATAEQVAANTQAFVQQVRAALPQVRFVYIPITITQARIKLAGEMRRSNKMVMEYLQTVPNTLYVDAGATILDDKGMPQTKYFLPDKLHLNQQGMELWIPVIKKALSTPVMP